MAGGLSIARRVTLAALLMVALHRLHLVFSVMGIRQVLHGLAGSDGITIAISATVVLNLLVLVPALRGRAWALAVGYLLLVNNLVFSGPFLLEDLATPARLGTWTWSAAVLVPNVLGLPYGAIALAEGLGRSVPAWLDRMQRRFLAGAAAAAGGMWLLAAALSLHAEPAAGLGEAPDAVVQVDLAGMAFRPARLELPKGRRTALFLINRDDYPHSFDVDALGIHVSVPARGSAVAVVHPEESREFDFYCGVAGHKQAGMTGIMAVR